MLPEPLEFDTIHDGLVELEAGERSLVIHSVSGYQVGVSKVPNLYLFALLKKKKVCFILYAWPNP